MGSKLARLIAVLVCSLLIGSAAGPAVRAANLSASDKEAIVGDWPHWTTQSLTESKCGSTGGSGTSPGPVYVVGDSIGTQYGPGLEGALNASGSSGWTVHVNAFPGRTLAPDGLSAVDGDKAVVQAAKTVIIELGTNSSRFNLTNLQAMINKVHSFAPNAKVYWIDTAIISSPGHDKTSLAASLSNVNSLIYSQSEANKYSVISWNKAVFGPNADPTTINPLAPDKNGYIRTSDGLNVHLTEPAGVAAYRNLIVNSLKSGAGGAVSGGCSCSTTLSGSDNKAKIWNYLKGKGLAPLQAAAVMGNLQKESGFEPRRVQYGGTNSRGEESVAGQPSSIDNNMRIDGTTGYGIAQWTFITRQQGLHNLAVSRGTIDGNLATQLDFLWGEMAGYLQTFNAFTDINLATRGFHAAVEGSADGEAGLSLRVSFATDILAGLGGGASGGASGCSNNGSIVETALLFSWPDKYPQSAALIPKPEYAAAIAKYNPGAAWNGADCGDFVATVMRASGADSNYELGPTPSQENYVRSHPELYDVVDRTSVNDLQPGDILIVNGSLGGGGSNGHTFIFVGNQPPNNYNQASASGGDRMPNLGIVPTDGSGIVNDSRGDYLRARLRT